jgi:hypothetical protein
LILTKRKNKFITIINLKASPYKKPLSPRNEGRPPTPNALHELWRKRTLHEEHTWILLLAPISCSQGLWPSLSWRLKPFANSLSNTSSFNISYLMHALCKYITYTYLNTSIQLQIDVNPKNSLNNQICIRTFKAASPVVV